MVFAPNQELSSKDLKKSSGANNMSTNKYCIPSKNAFIMLEIICYGCFLGNEFNCKKEAVTTNLS
jgi:hypothetical protein